MRDGLTADQATGAKQWDVLADTLISRHNGTEPDSPGAELPFATFAERLHPDASPSALRAAYVRLYRLACAAAATAGGDVDRPEEGRLLEEERDEGAEARISYNLAMTRDGMVVCLRVAEGDVVRDREGREVGRLALNGTVLAGTALVKSQEEWDALREDESQLWDILGRIGVPPSVSEKR